MIVMGVDPSLRSTGYAVVSSWKGRFRSIAIGTVQPPRKSSKGEALRYIQEGVRAEADRHEVQGIGMETGFVGRNSLTSLLLGEVRGAVLVAVCHLPVVEVEPSTAKLCLTGDGRAPKSAVMRAARNLLELEIPIGYDVADAVAVAVAAEPEIAELARNRVSSRPA